MRAIYRLARGAPGVVGWRRWCKARLAAKTAGLLALALGMGAGAEARIRALVEIAPKSAKATDGVVLARGAQVGGRGAVLLALLPRLLAPRAAV